MPDGDLPGDITVDILSRLPVKTLTRFAAICKSWQSLISSPNFIQLHLRRSYVNPRNHYLLLHRPCRDTITISPLNFSGTPSISTFSIPVVQDPPALPTPFRYGNGGIPSTTLITPVEVDGVSTSSLLPMCGGSRTVNGNRNSVDSRLRLVGSINGLVCFSVPPLRPTNAVIWNPATRKFKNISVSHLNLSAPFRIHVAFAFDSVLNDYKIVCIYRFRSRKSGGGMSFRFSMYSCNANSWKELQPNFPIHLGFISGCATVKGNPYWMGFHNEEETWLSVNVQTEVIQLFSRPEYARNAATMISPLNLNDLAAQIVRSPGLLSNDLIDVYALDENSGVWNKIYTIGSNPLRSPLSLQCYRNGEFVIKDREGKLFTYDPVSKGIKDLGIGEGMEAHYVAINYSESLVAIGGMQYIGEEAGEETAPCTIHRNALNASLPGVSD